MTNPHSPMTNLRSLTIVNRHYPPNPGITGESAWDLADYLIRQHGFAVRVVHMARSDDGGGAVRQPVGETFAVPTVYRGKQKQLKLLAGFLDGILLTVKTIQVRRGPVLCLTSPPLLPLWLSLAVGRAGWLLWSMDLFPQAFAATGQLSATGWLYKLLLRQTYRRPPRHLVALGPGQARFVQAHYGRALPTTILPCGVLLNQERAGQPPVWRPPGDDRLYFGYVGNLGDAHSPDFLLDFMAQLDPARHRFILATYGPKAGPVLDAARHRPGVAVLDRVPRAELGYIDVHLVSLVPAWTHLAVPSKALSSVCAGATVLFCGQAEADTWTMLQPAAWLLDIERPLPGQIRAFLDGLTPAHITAKRRAADALTQTLHQQVIRGYDELAALLMNNEE
jgi:hypothetical protein